MDINWPIKFEMKKNINIKTVRWGLSYKKGKNIYEKLTCF